MKARSPHTKKPMGSLPNESSKSVQELDQVDPQWAWDTYQTSVGRPWTGPLAAHFFRRAGFGANAKAIEEALKLTPAALAKKWVASSVESKEFKSQADALARTVVAGGDPKQLAAAWVYRLLYTPNQLLEKMTLFWHGHFATGADKVQDSSMMWTQNQLLRQNALGDFEPMVQSIARDPAMLIYLDSASNRKAHPNENFARELMELFCLGEGNYSEKDVQQLARCFTGWEIKNKQFRKNAYQHDNESKSLLGRTGNFDGEDAVRIVLDQEAMPYFIVGKLVRFFVFDEPRPSKELLKPLADDFRSNGLKVGPVIERILRSQLFYSHHAIARKVRSPIELAIGFLRSLDGTTNTVKLAEGLTQLGHGLFYPPNVKGWDGGRAWINSSTLLGRANLMQQILHGESTQYRGQSIANYLDSQGLKQPAQIVQWLASQLIAIPLSTKVESQLIEILGKSAHESTIRAAIHALCTLPEFQLS
jgi:uncharacterized protein (DUF1800 family)